MQQIIMIVLLLVVAYFFMIRPQQKRQKELKKFREGLEKGDKVITMGGIHGKVVEIGDTNVVISCEGGTKMRIEKSSLLSGPEHLVNAQR